MHARAYTNTTARTHTNLCARTTPISAHADTYAREHAAAAAALAAPATKGGTPGSAAAAAGVPGGGMATRGQQQKEAQAEPKEGGAKDAASPPASAPAKRGRKPSAVSAEKAAAGKAPAKVSRPGPQKRRVAVVGTGVCVQCGATSTPQWREGPEGGLGVQCGGACGRGQHVCGVCLCASIWVHVGRYACWGARTCRVLMWVACTDVAARRACGKGR